MNHFGAAVKNLFAPSDEFNNNILETVHHSKVFEKIDTSKYFRIAVSVVVVVSIDKIDEMWTLHWRIAHNKLFH